MPATESRLVEAWREVPGWPDYAVSDLGRVKRIRKPYSGRGRVGAILKARIPGGGEYPAVCLFRDRKGTNWYVHRLVMLAFVAPCPEGQEVNHIDGVKTNAALANLEYVDRPLNIQHAFRTGLKSNKGAGNSRAILKPEDVLAIRAASTGRYGEQSSIARQYGVSPATVRDIITGRRWSDLQAA